MSCCITSRQLHNSPIYTPSFASGHIHTFPHAAQLALNKQGQQGPSGDRFPFDVCCFWWQVICVSVHGRGRGKLKTMPALWASWKHECCSSKMHISEQRGEQLLCWIISTSFVCAAGSVCVFVTNASCVYWSVSCRCPGLQVRSRLLWSSPHPEAGAGHPSLSKEGQPGWALHQFYTYTIRTLSVQFKCSKTPLLLNSYEQIMCLFCIKDSGPLLAYVKLILLAWLIIL